MLKNKPLAIFLCTFTVVLSILLSFSLRTVRATSLPFEYDYSSSDLGTGAVELSGITYNGARDRLLLLDNASSVILHEFDVDSSTGRPEAAPRRQIELVGMGGDVESVTWVQNDTYAVMDENTGQIHVFEIIDGSSDLTVLGSAEAMLETGIVENGGAGAEGLTYLPNHNGQDWFIAVDEGPTTIVAVSTDGSSRHSAEIQTPSVTDFSGVYMSAADGMLYVVSDETTQVAQFQVSELLTSYTEVASQSLVAGDVEQIEGVTFDPTMRYMYIASETESNSGSGFGLWVAPVAISPSTTSTRTSTQEAPAASGERGTQKAANSAPYVVADPPEEATLGDAPNSLAFVQPSPEPSPARGLRRLPAASVDAPGPVGRTVTVGRFFGQAIGRDSARAPIAIATAILAATATTLALERRRSDREHRG